MKASTSGLIAMENAVPSISIIKISFKGIFRASGNPSIAIAIPMNGTGLNFEIRCAAIMNDSRIVLIVFNSSP